MTTTLPETDSGSGVRRFTRRHPYLSFLLIFNTVGQAAAFVPLIAERVYGVGVSIDQWLIVPTLLFLLLPALVVTRIARGRDGLRQLVRSMFRLRIKVRWYLLPLLAVPALTMVTALPAPPEVTVGKTLVVYLTTYVPALLFQFLTTNWWEETVWLGFFQVPLQDRFGPWRAVLITTPFFALEHISLVFGSTVAERLVQFALIMLVTVPTRALLAWVYNRTGSLALAGLVHAASNAAGLSLVPPLFHSPGGGGSALLLLGVVVIAATRGRLGLPTPPASSRRGDHSTRLPEPGGGSSPSPVARTSSKA
jgi:membrane protease YdiL (CAAX protease family)